MSIRDRVKETSTTTGTGDFTLGGAATGYRSFNTAFGTNFLFQYAIVGGTEWETGKGYLSGASTLVRLFVYDSTNSGALVNFSAGTKDVFCSIVASQHVNQGRVLSAARGMQIQ